MGFKVLLHFENGYVNDRSSFTSYWAAVEFCRTCAGGRIHRIEIDEGHNGKRVMWDRSWTPLSRATLYKDYV